MPFTGSHPAAILPFVPSAIPPSALAIGSMIPDLPMFMKLPYSVQFSHSFSGAITVDLVAGAGAFVVWRTVLRPVLVEYAPPELARRLPPPADARPQWVVVGLAIGALTHVGWDGLTHADGWAVRRSGALQQQVGPLPAYEWAQHASGLVGAAILAGWSVGWWRRTDPIGDRPHTRERHLVPGRRLAYGLVVGCGLAAAAIGWWKGMREPDRLRTAPYYAAVAGIDAGAGVVLCVAAARRLTSWVGRLRSRVEARSPVRPAPRRRVTT